MNKSALLKFKITTFTNHGQIIHGHVRNKLIKISVTKLDNLDENKYTLKRQNKAIHYVQAFQWEAGVNKVNIYFKMGGGGSV